MSGARVSSGPDSRQDYATPRDFMDAVVARFGDVGFDLAASRTNTKAQFYCQAPDDPDEWFMRRDAFAQDWNEIAETHGLLWLNPPFADIAPWVRKCAASKGATILLLVPAAVGSNWFRDHVAGIADVSLLNGRLCFDGKGLYPKDCMLARYAPDAAGRIDVWTWKRETNPMPHLTWRRA